MSDPRERTPEEREAARRERARRRGGVFHEQTGDGSFVDWSDPGAPAPPEAEPPGASAPPEAEPPGAAPEAGPAASAPPPAEVPRDGTPTTAEPQHPAAAEPPLTEEHDLFGDDEPFADTEVPSGTRRVSRVPHRGAGRGRDVGRGRGRGRGRSAAAGAALGAGRPRRHTLRGNGNGNGPGAGSRSGRGHSLVGRGVVVIMVVLAAVLAWFVVELFQLFGTSPHGRVTVVVPAHSGAHQVGDLLARDGVIPSGFFFELRATLAGDRGAIRAGTYHLQQGMSYGAVLAALTKVPKAAPTTTLTIVEGHTRRYVAALLRRQHIVGNYMALTRRSPLLSPQAYGAPRSVQTLEGFLFPDTFTLLDPVRASALVADQLRDFKQRFAAVNLSYARSKGLSPYDVLKVASLIEAEAATPHDLPLVASVIYNRLRIGMMLQLDSTTRYATGNLTGPLTESQLHDPSPYNTRVHTGLPPTPIDNPGLASIQAAAHPAHTRYLYFFTKPCGNHNVFTTSYAEFNRLYAADQRNHCP